MVRKKNGARFPIDRVFETIRHRGLRSATFTDRGLLEFKTPTTRNNPDPAEQGISVYGNVTPTEEVRGQLKRPPSHHFGVP